MPNTWTELSDLDLLDVWDSISNTWENFSEMVRDDGEEAYEAHEIRRLHNQERIMGELCEEARTRGMIDPETNGLREEWETR